MLRRHWPSPAAAAAAAGAETAAAAGTADEPGPAAEMVAAAGAQPGTGVLWLRRRLLAAGFVSAGAGGGRAAHCARTNHGTAGVCLPRGRRGQGVARPAGGGLLGNATAPSPGPSSGDDRRRAGWGWTALTISAVPGAPNTPSEPPNSSSRRCRGPEARRCAEPRPTSYRSGRAQAPGGARGRDAWTRVRPPGRARTGRTTRSWSSGSLRSSGSAGDRPSASASCLGCGPGPRQ